MIEMKPSFRRECRRPEPFAKVPIALLGLLALAALWSLPASAQVNVQMQSGFPWQGVSMFTTVMALLYAGHLAQDRTSLGWRILLFILGFPLTFIVTFLVVPGSQRVLGVDLPRHDLQGARSGDAESDDFLGAAAEASEADDPRRERKAAWDGAIAFLIGISTVFFLAPSTEYRSQPLGDNRFAVQKTAFWGFWDSPWLSYRREGVQERTRGDGWVEPEWTTDPEWTFEASVHGLVSLVFLLVVFVLVVRDERLRTRALEASSDPPQRAA